MSPIRIVCWGGIGDGLRALSLVPHDYIYRQFGVRYPVVFWKHTPLPIPWARPFFERLVRRCPSVRWEGELPERRGIVEAGNRKIGELLKRLNGGVPRYFPVDIRLSDEERRALPPATRNLTIGVQTHLEGIMRSKSWPLSRWQAFVAGLVSAYPGCRVIILDKSEHAAALQMNSNVLTTVGFDIAQSIHVVESLDLLISVDSWSKYVAAWNQIPQLLLVPDQQVDYEMLSPRHLLHNELAGLYGAPNVDVIGLSADSPEPRFTFGEMADLSAEHLLARAAASIAKLQRRRHSS
jgi:hypothetical protein